VSIVLAEAEEWRESLKETFTGLVPDHVRGSGPVGRLAKAQLGEVSLFTVVGEPQTLRRSVAQSRRLPTDLLKVCIQRSGSAVVQQGDREVAIGPGQMALYDIARPYALRLEGSWRCDVIAFPRIALPLAERDIATAMRNRAPTHGPGQLLTALVRNVISEGCASGSQQLASAAVALVAAAFAGSDHVPADRDAQRLRVIAFIRAHLSDPDLDHNMIAGAHHLSPRSLHRLFESEPNTASQLIRSLRLDAIRRDLSSEQHVDESIATVAARWGIYDMAGLCRRFRSLYGMTPSDVRPVRPRGGGR